ncbi:MAG: hypothetical protein JWN52_4694 [Actinomycetia bacterium]|nr:hypothetical protein [Actinomycetes bacterium]
MSTSITTRHTIPGQCMRACSSAGPLDERPATGSAHHLQLMAGLRCTLALAGISLVILAVLGGAVREIRAKGATG